MAWTRRPAALDRAAPQPCTGSRAGPRPRAGLRPRGGRTPGCGGAGLRAAGRAGAHGAGRWELAARAPSTRPPLTQPPGDDPPTDTSAAAPKPTMPRHLPGLLSCSGLLLLHRPAAPAPWLARAYAGWGPAAQGAARTARLTGAPASVPYSGTGQPGGGPRRRYGLGGNGRKDQTERDRKGPREGHSPGARRSWTRARLGLDGWAGESGANKENPLMPASIPFHPSPNPDVVQEKIPSSARDKSCPGNPEVREGKGRYPRSLIANRARLPFS